MNIKKGILSESSLLHTSIFMKASKMDISM